MSEFATPPLSHWANFYVIVGSAAAAVIGVQFVVIALVANRRAPATAESIRAFATPTVVHLGAALFVAASMSAPWLSLHPVSVVLALCGLGGLGYGGMVIHRARRQTTYAPVWQDWLWYAILPCSLYAALALGALLLRAVNQLALFVVGAAALGLLLIGIHNAWDTVTHIAVERAGEMECPGPSLSRMARGDGEKRSMPSQKEAEMDIKRSGSQPSGKGPTE